MRIAKTDDFQKDRKALPHDAQQILRKQEGLFLSNPFDPRLHAKKLKELSGIYSFRVTRRYRVLFYLENKDTAVFFAVGHRKEIYKDAKK